MIGWDFDKECLHKITSNKFGNSLKKTYDTGVQFSGDISIVDE